MGPEVLEQGCSLCPSNRERCYFSEALLFESFSFRGFGHPIDVISICLIDISSNQNMIKCSLSVCSRKNLDKTFQEITFAQFGCQKSVVKA